VAQVATWPGIPAWTGVGEQVFPAKRPLILLWRLQATPGRSLQCDDPAGPLFPSRSVVCMRNTSALDLTRSVPPTVGGLAQDAEVAVSAQRFGGVVDGVGLAVGADDPGCLLSGSADANRDGIGDAVQFAWRGFAETVEEAGFRNRLHLKGVGAGILRQTVGGRRREVDKPRIARIPRFSFRHRIHDLQP